MNNRFNRILLTLLMVWLPLAFFVRSADGFTLTKELVGLLVVIYFALLTIMKGAKIYRQPLVIATMLFAVWMVADSYWVGQVKPEVGPASFHLWLILGTLITVAFACSRGVSYERLLIWTLVTGAFMSIYGFFQVMGLDRYNWTTRFDARAFATMGNPDYLGGYLVALLPLAFVLTLRTYGQLPFGVKKFIPATSSQKSWFGLRTLTLLLFVGLLLTRVKGSFLALGVVVVFMGISFLFPVGSGLFKKNKRYVLICLAVLMVGAGSYIYRHGGLRVFSDNQISVEQRINNYQVAWAMIRDHFWRGVGLGQIGVQYPRYQALAYTPSEYSNHPFTYSDHVHNDFLQFWVEGGIIGLVLFLVVLGIYVLAVLRFFKSPEMANADKELLLAVLASMIALLTQSMSNFPLQIAPTAVLFGLFLAAPLALRPPTSVSSTFKLSALQQAILTLAIMIFLIFALPAVAASIAIRDTRGETALNKPQMALYFGNLLVALSPQDFQAWSAQAAALTLAGKKDQALAAYQRSLDLNPNDVEDLAEMANLQLLQGQPAAALALCNRALAITPNYSDPMWTRGVCLFQLRHYEQSAQSFEQFLTYMPKDPQTYLNLGVCYIKLHRKADAIAAWEKAFDYDPSNTQALIYLKSQGISLK